MLIQTDYNISTDILQAAQEQLPKIDSRFALNQPTGSFFSDEWLIKPEFENSVWATILGTIPGPIGEARLIKLEQGMAYPSHADIDDRWHLNITGDRTYLIDLESDTMYPTGPDGHWYLMDAGTRHSAVNFGSDSRIQLVVRKLLAKNAIKNPVNVCLTFKHSLAHNRFIFDDIVSPWLNRAYKKGIVSDFVGEDSVASFDIEIDYLEELEEVTRGYFIVSVNV